MLQECDKLSSHPEMKQRKRDSPRLSSALHICSVTYAHAEVHTATHTKQVNTHNKIPNMFLKIINTFPSTVFIITKRCIA